MTTRERLDKIAWHTIHTASVVRDEEPSGYAKSKRPANYTEFGQMIKDTGDDDLAFSEFLHEFYRFRTASFFAERPPEFLSPSWRALLAGTAEFLSEEFNLPVPEWVHEPQYTLPEAWDPWADILPDGETFRELSISLAHPTFLKHNVIFESRNLIRL